MQTAAEKDPETKEDVLLPLAALDQDAFDAELEAVLAETQAQEDALKDRFKGTAAILLCCAHRKRCASNSVLGQKRDSICKATKDLRCR
jgi:hypothetical protein